MICFSDLTGQKHLKEGYYVSLTKGMCGAWHSLPSGVNFGMALTETRKLIMGMISTRQMHVHVGVPVYPSAVAVLAL